MNEDLKLPDVFMGDDDVYYAAGHVNRAEFLLACVADTAENCGLADVGELLFGGDVTRGRVEIEAALAHVRHSWYRSLNDPDNDEAVERCEADSEGAMAYTEFSP